jgi:uncharacterized protein YbjT (DUF2867 family)
MITAIVLGATGLVGRALVGQLIADKRFDRVVLLVRRKVKYDDPKVTSHVIDFDKPDTWRGLVKGDVLFSTLGTTLKQAGSKEAQYKVDFDYQYNAAKVAAENGVGSYVLVSSASASPKSVFFYSRMKGELEEAVRKLPFKRIAILRPGVLSGNRTESRPAEKLAIAVLNVLHHLPGLGAQKPYDVKLVARAMINAYVSQVEPVRVYELKEVFALAERK